MLVFTSCTAPFLNTTQPRPSAEDLQAKPFLDLTKPRPSAGDLQAPLRNDPALAQRNLELKRQERAARAKQTIGSEDIDTDALFKQTENIQAFQRNKAHSLEYLGKRGC